MRVRHSRTPQNANEDVGSGVKGKEHMSRDACIRCKPFMKLYIVAK